MKQWISRVVSAYEREPGLCLFAASVALAVVFWHLPVPPFLFADPGSASAAQCNCTMTNKNCESWEKDGARGCPAAGSGWEDCIHALREQANCEDKGPKKWPQFYYVYEKCHIAYPGGPCVGNCERTQSCEHTDRTKDVCHMKYVRTSKGAVGVHTWGSGGVRTIHFQPYVGYSFEGFTHNNVCNPTVEGLIDFGICVFAKMEVCRETKTDVENYGGTSGWAFKSETFKKNAHGRWVSPPDGGVAFNIHTTKTCEECGDAADDPKQYLHVACHVYNTGGVKLGQVCIQALISFDVSTDKTECYQGQPKKD